MSVLCTSGLVILGLVLVVGIIRVMTLPYRGFINLLVECMLLDYLVDSVLGIAEYISDIWD